MRHKRKQTKRTLMYFLSLSFVLFFFTNLTSFVSLSKSSSLIENLNCDARHDDDDKLLTVYDRSLADYKSFQI